MFSETLVLFQTRFNWQPKQHESVVKPTEERFAAVCFAFNLHSTSRVNKIRVHHSKTREYLLDVQVAFKRCGPSLKWDETHLDGSESGIENPFKKHSFMISLST